MKPLKWFLYMMCESPNIVEIIPDKRYCHGNITPSLISEVHWSLPIYFYQHKTDQRNIRIRNYFVEKLKCSSFILWYFLYYLFYNYHNIPILKGSLDTLMSSIVQKYDLYRIVALDICCSKNNGNLLIYVGCFFFIRRSNDWEEPYLIVNKLLS